MSIRDSAQGEPAVTPPAAFPDPSLFRARALPQLLEGRYRVRFAEDARDLERVLRLRFEVFNLELNEGLESSYVTGLDLDPFDLVCDHLLVVEERTGRLVGTYRMQSATAHGTGLGLYCAQEFDLTALPADVMQQSVELGRACILSAHRNGHVLYALWRGLAAYCTWTRRRYLFGCCSLTSQDLEEGRAFERYLRRTGRMHDAIHVAPWPRVACGDASEAVEGEPDPDVPKLFATYLRYGAKACGPPAIDRDFKTIDFLVLLDLMALDLRVRRMFFAGIPEHRPEAAESGAARPEGVGP